MIQIQLPVPHRVLSPNSRTHWGTKLKWVREHRLLALNALKAAAPEVSAIEAPAVLFVLVKTKCPDNRLRDVWDVRDRDNFHAGCKAYLDGLADSGIFGGGDAKCRSYPEIVRSPDKRHLSHVLAYIGTIDEIMEEMKCQRTKDS
jgi:hypothetical protein